MSRISRDDILGDRIVRLDLRLERAQPFGDEAAHHVDQRIEGFGVERHGHPLLLVPRC